MNYLGSGRDWTLLAASSRCRSDCSLKLWERPVWPGPLPRRSLSCSNICWRPYITSFTDRLRNLAYSHLTCTKEMLPWELLGRNRCSFALYAALASLMWVSQVARSVVEPACSSYSWAPTWTLPPVFMR